MIWMKTTRWAAWCFKFNLNQFELINQIFVVQQSSQIWPAISPKSRALLGTPCGDGPKAIKPYLEEEPSMNQPFSGSYNVRPPLDSVQLVHITPISLWFFGTYNELVTGANLNQLITITGGPHIDGNHLLWPEKCLWLSNSWLLGVKIGYSNANGGQEASGKVLTHSQKGEIERISGRTTASTCTRRLQAGDDGNQLNIESLNQIKPHWKPYKISWWIWYSLVNIIYIYHIPHWIIFT